MDKIFQKICDIYPHYKINTKLQRKFFYVIFKIFEKFLKGPFKLNFSKFLFLAYPQKNNYSRSLLNKAVLHDEGYLTFFLNNIDNKSIFIDCGANQGFYTIPIAASNPECVVYAFEPSLQEMAYLNKNIELNDFKNVRTFDSGIGDIEGSFYFLNDNLEKNSTKGGLIIDNNEGNSDEVKKIKVTTIDKIVENYINNINSNSKIFIKIDIEGYDINAVYGAKSIINKYSTIILIEFSKMAIASRIYSKQHFSNFLDENNLIILDVFGKEYKLDDLHLQLDSLKDNQMVCGNYLIIKQDLIEKLKFNKDL